LIAGAPRSDNAGKYRSRNLVVRHLLARFLHRVSELAASQRPRRILEVGCGEGFVLATLAARLPGSRLDGLELDETALGEARRRCPAAALVRGDACALPFRAESFDLVVCLEVLEHLPEPVRALRELRRVTRAGCLLSVPHEPFFRLGNFLRGKNVTRLGNPTDHLQHWGAGEFAAFCDRELAVRIRTTAFPWLIVYGSV
jgi:ubiquinone/menaquinone biosynthesis C-methylase UbiE